MNPDQQLVQSAYEDAIKGLYAKLFDGYAAAGGDQAQEQQAELLDRRYLSAEITRSRGCPACSGPDCPNISAEVSKNRILRSNETKAALGVL
jgi:hypothetical protein